MSIMAIVLVVQGFLDRTWRAFRRARPGRFTIHADFAVACPFLRRFQLDSRRRLTMTFDLLKHMHEFDRKGFGTARCDLGLLKATERGTYVDAEPTDRLRWMFGGSVNLATVYPLLTELMASYQEGGGDRHVEWKLKAAGMTDDGLEAFNEMLGR
jgi:hypothetical protein